MSGTLTDRLNSQYQLPNDTNNYTYPDLSGANLSGAENPKSFNDISQDLKENVDYIVNLRQSEVMNIPSSIIKIDVNGTIQKIR